MILKLSITALIFVQAGMLGLLSNSAIVPLIAMVCGAFLFAKPIQLNVNLSAKILVPVCLVIYFGIRAFVINASADDSTRLDFVFPSWATVALGECFLLGQIFELIKTRNARDGLINFCMLAMACIVCSCSRYASGSDKSLVFLGTIVGITLICTIFQYSTRAYADEQKATRANFANRGLMIGSTMLLVGFGTWYFSGFFQDNILEIQKWWVKNMSRQVTGLGQSKIGYSSFASLRNITDLKKSDPMNPVLHVYFDSAPGYLRGLAYEVYEDGDELWYRDEKRVLLPEKERPSFLEKAKGAYFEITSPGGQRSKFKQIKIETPSESEFTFLPLNTHYIAALPNSARVQKTVSNSINGINTQTEYTGFIGKQPTRESPLQILTDHPKTLTVPKLSGADEIEALATEITNGASNDQERIALIEEFFQENFEYSLEQEEFPKRDKLSYFIRERPAAHCEFFASAAVVMLRLNGIPARYVTGFATDEVSDEEDYYIARNKDAHAWAEAYDSDKQHWVIVEATPGTEYPKTLWNDLESGSLGSSSNGENDSTSSSRFAWSSFFRRFLLQTGEFFAEFGRQLRGPLNIALTGLILFGIFYRYWWLPRKDPALKTRQGALAREREKMERLLARKKIYRQSNETMLQFEMRIKNEVDPELASFLQPVFKWLREYEQVRFGADLPEELIPLTPKL